MKTMTKFLTGFLVLALGITAFASVASASTEFSEKGEMKGFHGKHVEERSFDGEHFEAMKEAIDNYDYDAWYELAIEHPKGEKLVELITPDNFDLFVEMIQAKMDGDRETAREIREGLGLKMHR